MNIRLKLLQEQVIVVTGASSGIGRGGSKSLNGHVYVTRPLGSRMNQDVW
ncbi:MAG: hypothetical protein OJF50_002662 [Nitrospira sp.]|nr:hypothetical protein [Nitrospira sp.]